MTNDNVCMCSGSYDIYVGGKRLGSYNDTGFFGELALMYNQPRAATIIAASPGVLWAMVSKTQYQSSKQKPIINRGLAGFCQKVEKPVFLSYF